MAMPSGFGAALKLPANIPAHAFLFGEDQARYVVTASVKDADAIVASGISILKLGVVKGRDITIDGGHSIAVARLREAHESWFPRYMGKTIN